MKIEIPQRRIFFLGAGFSKPAGLPLGNELLDAVLYEADRYFGKDSILRRSLRSYEEFLQATTGSTPQTVDIEAFGTYLDHQHSFKLLGSDTWSDGGNRDQMQLRWTIGRVLHQRTPSTTPDLYRSFVSHLGPSDVIVTFNYDLLLENALCEAGKRFRRFPSRYSEVHNSHSVCDSDAEDGELLLMKVHGSMDWVSREHYDKDWAYLQSEGVTRNRNPIWGDQSITTTRPLTEGLRPADDPLLNIEVIEDLDSYYGGEESHYPFAWTAPPFLLAPSHVKTLYGGALKDLWSGMALAGWGWGGLVIVGYSMPQEDSYVQQVLYSLSRGYVRSFKDSEYAICKKDRIKLVDYRQEQAGIDQLRNTYRFLDWQHVDPIFDGFSDANVNRIFERPWADHRSIWPHRQSHGLARPQ